MTTEQLKQKILKVLERGKYSTTAISEQIEEGYYKTVILLEQMERDELIVRESKKYQTFWELEEENTQITKYNDENDKEENYETFA
jgi:hypothetical protein